MAIDGGNSFALATSLGIIRGRGSLAVNDTVNATDLFDWFKFKVIAKSSGTSRTINSVTTRLRQSSTLPTSSSISGVSTRVDFFSSKVSRPLQEGQLTLLGRNSFSKAGALQPGLYYIKVTSGDGETQYSLRLRATLLKGKNE